MARPHSPIVAQLILIAFAVPVNDAARSAWRVMHQIDLHGVIVRHDLPTQSRATRTGIVACLLDRHAASPLAMKMRVLS